MAIFGVFGIILSASLFLLDRPTRHIIVGFLTCASLISMFASPLFIIVSLLCTNNILFVSFKVFESWYPAIYPNTIMLTQWIRSQRLVIRTKSVEFMPFYLSLSTFAMSLSFMLYGIFNFDPFVYVSFMPIFAFYMKLWFCFSM